MNQEKSKERRRKKNVLKHRVIQERDLSQEDLERKIRAHRKKIRKRVVLGIFLGVLVLGAFFIYENIRTYGSYSVQWETEKIASGEVNYSAFAGGLLQYGSDGIMYYDKDGDMMWSQAYQMNSPRLAINGSYLLVYDIGSIQFMVFDQNGYVGGGSAPIPIILGSISSKQGVVTLIGEESLGHIFYFYDRKGTKLDIEKKTLFTDSGYPLSMSTSSDGESVMVSFAYIEGGTLQNRIAFYNFEEGKSDPDRLMGVFQKYGDTLVADVKFLEADKAVAVGDDQLLFYSLTTAAIPQENGAVEVNGEILRVVYGDEKVGIQVREDSGDVLYIYNASGKELLAFDLEGIVEDIQLTSKRVYILYNESLQIINYRGNGIFSGSVGEEVKKVVPTSSRNKLLVVDGTSLFGLRLK